MQEYKKYVKFGIFPEDRFWREQERGTSGLGAYILYLESGTKLK